MYLGMGMKVIETSLKLQNKIISNSAFYRKKIPFSLNIYLILRTLKPKLTTYVVYNNENIHFKLY